MTIAEILAQQQYLPAIQQRTQQQATQPASQSFAATLKEFLSDVNTLEIRNRAIDLYREIIRIQV